MIFSHKVKHTHTIKFTIKQELVHWEWGINMEWGVFFSASLSQNKNGTATPYKDCIPGFALDWEHSLPNGFHTHLNGKQNQLIPLRSPSQLKGMWGRAVCSVTWWHFLCNLSFWHVVHYGLLCCGNELGTASNFMKTVLPRLQNKRLKPFFPNSYYVSIKVRLKIIGFPAVPLFFLQ